MGWLRNTKIKIGFSTKNPNFQIITVWVFIKFEINYYLSIPLSIITILVNLLSTLSPKVLTVKQNPTETNHSIIRN